VRLSLLDAGLKAGIWCFKAQLWGYNVTMSATTPSRRSLADYISKDPKVCGGKACIVGTRIRVQDIYILHELRGLSIEEIVEGYPQMTPAEAHAALAYYWDNRQEILDEIKAGEELVEQIKKAQGPSPLQRKLAGRHGTNP
jgi:uncharacterized protein (DUF433 family)